MRPQKSELLPSSGFQGGDKCCEFSGAPVITFSWLIFDDN